ncbi:HNH endonuclease [Enteractinococcus coprophilus]|uniref:HNH endonuclease n=1 Tax=Enteractinococcus coprophilus TaxID=1027633 RepID=A0A543AIE7_9MICC|nr:DUF222 domain-containing protein [Enteractinococcus coprophilus]TQL72352.1 HNH endonuclease [Enteractinococcus coprophilus]
MTTTTAPGLKTLAELPEVLSLLAPAETQAGNIDQIEFYERIKAAAEAGQARATAKLAEQRHDQEKAQGIPKSKRCKGLGAEIGLARKESPARGKQRLELARVLVENLPRTYQALCDGQIREEHAQAMANEISALPARHQREIDDILSDRLGAIGPRQLANEARAQVQRLDPQGAAKRLRDAEAERRVGIRPAAKGLSQLVAIGPTPQIAALCDTLRQEANSALSTGTTKDHRGESRTRDQLMFDMLIERGTGQAAAPAVPVEVMLVMTPDTLFAQGGTPAWLTGHGPIPAAVARDWLSQKDVSVLLRRLFTNPEANQVVGLESRARGFRSNLRKLILLRDNICRTPYCEAPIQDVDHITPRRDGGATAWENASGLCAACNQTKENRGWRHTGDSQGMQITTPTGHVYTVASQPVLPGRDPRPRTPRRPSSGQHDKEPADNPPQIPRAGGSQRCPEAGLFSTDKPTL